MNPTRSEMLAEVIRRREALKNDRSTEAKELELLRQELDALEKSLLDENLSLDAWEQHELHWQANMGETWRDLIYLTAESMFALEWAARENPEKFANDPKWQEMVRFWREQGGREGFLGDLPIEQRRELEEKERQWREKHEK